MSGILLDSHALYWLVSGEVELLDGALDAIGENQEAGTLFVSPITAWEISTAARKRRLAGRPHLGGDSPERWFREAVRATSARIVPIRQRISLAAARVVTETGHKDPGDCFLIASARVRGMPIVTRDQIMQSLAAERPGYLDVIVC
ncbi:MAG TPA: type II toxin-antitoxin system VapC family toxin [Allosphingosinicella sp.]|nr:type II toxin-antitoxin system VapC family toxin [Allosphingosinicella sp.]